MNIFEKKDLLYGGDYNPEQWIGCDGIWEEDLCLMKKAGVNCVSLGIFSWAMIEREEGVFDFSWLDTVIDTLYKNAISVILATPSGARPPWLAQKYPEVLRVREDRVKHLYGRRHNHCFSSPVYRNKTAIIDEKLSERYGHHPAVIMWHISNELSGDCHCPNCQARFREWLKEKYDNDIEKLNHAWWGTFWSHRYTDWSQIESPSSIGDSGTHGHVLDWKRFSSDIMIEFYKNEVSAVKKHSDLPVTTNFMEVEDIDYYKFAKNVDIVSWDCYPRWHNNKETVYDTAAWASFHHDMFRSMKQKPFLMMESTPSLVNWHDTNKLKAPGLNILSSIQAVAHGSEGVLYFQIRKSRGASEKFHGALIDHDGSGETRVFNEAAELGRILKENPELKGSYTQSETAVVYDFENSWAVNEMCGLKRERSYKDTCIKHYKALRGFGMNVDVISPDADFSQYKLISAPMLYMLPDKIAEKIREYISNGGIFIATYLTSYVNENDLCHLGGFPGGLKDVFGIWNEEIDSIYDENAIISNGKEYTVTDFCERIHPDKHTEVLGTYKYDFYAGEPAVTSHKYNKGIAYYIAARTSDDYLQQLYNAALRNAEVTSIIGACSEGISITTRGSNVFVMNFSDKNGELSLNGDKIILEPYECKIV